MRYTNRPSVLPLVLVAVLFGLTACDESKPAGPEGDSKLPPANIDLPAIPSDLGDNAIPERHVDGSLTIDGLKRNRLSWLDKEVTVKGQIAWVYKCPYEKDDKKKKPRKRKPEEEAEEEGPRCQRAHFYIIDKNGEADLRLLVVGLTDELEESFEKGDLKVGDEHTMTGTFLEIGNGFVASDEGLVVLGTIKGFEPEEEENGKGG